MIVGFPAGSWETLRKPPNYGENFTNRKIKMTNERHKLIASKPLYRFWYKGKSHSHPVRRTVLVFRTTDTHIFGYEVRSGNMTIPYESAPIKTYRKDKIALYGQYCRLYGAKKNKDKNPRSSTLKRSSIREYFEVGA